MATAMKLPHLPPPVSWHIRESASVWVFNGEQNARLSCYCRFSSSPRTLSFTTTRMRSQIRRTKGHSFGVGSDPQSCAIWLLVNVLVRPFNHRVVNLEINTVKHS